MGSFALKKVDTDSFILLRETWSHMSSVSGFDPLFVEFVKLVGPGAKSFFVPGVSPKMTRLERLLAKAPRLTGYYDVYDLKNAPAPGIEPRQNAIAGSLLREANKSPQSLILLSSAESQYGQHFLEAPPSVRNRLVLFMHQPDAYHRLFWLNKSALNGLKAIVCLSENQERYFKSITSTPVLRTHLGVSHNFFQPGQKLDPASSPRVLIVGLWFRDFDTLASSFALLQNTRSDVLLDCVIPLVARNVPPLRKLAQNTSVSWHANISADELLTLYQRCNIVFIPLSDAAANCAILEAFACGKPVVSTRVGGVQEYFEDSFGELCEPGDCYAHFQAMHAWLNDPQRCAAAGAAARKYAVETRTWSDIAKKLLHDLKSLD